jgi:curli biogenesis system outer membrane secretion channel CsgG
MNIQKALSAFVFIGTLAGCATESSQSVAVQQTASQSSANAYSGVRHPIIVGQFDNKSNYMRGMFTDGEDRLGSQAKTTLIGHLQRTRRFSIMERDNMDALSKEAKYRNATQKIKGAKYVVVGDVTEFGRKDTGDKQLFGILGSGKKQTAYSKVTLNVIDADSSEVVFSASGAGEYALSDREVVGFGGSSGYDSTLNGKVIDLSIREAVDRLVEGLQNGDWSL